MTYRFGNFGATSYNTTTGAFSGGIDLPRARVQEDIGTDSILGSVIQLPGGRGYDTRFTNLGFAVGGIVSGRAEMITIGGNVGLIANLDDLRSHWGAREKLWIIVTAGEARWRNARLLSVNQQGQAGMVSFQPLEMQFELDPDYWRGTARDALTTSVALSSNVNVENGGNLFASDVRLTIHAGALDVTGSSGPALGTTVTISTGTGVHWGWNGHITAGNSVGFNLGAWNFSTTISDVFNITFGSEHSIDDLMKLERNDYEGNTLVKIILNSGTGAGFQFRFDDPWA